MVFFALPTGGGSPILTTNGVPTGTLGNLGDLAIDKADAEVKLYGPKEGGGWPTGVALRGPTGAVSTVPGPTGPASTVTGPTGAQGESITGPTGPASTVTGPTGAQGESVTGPTGPASTVTGPAGAQGESVTGPTGSTGPAPAVTSGPTSDTVYIGGVLVTAAVGPTGPSVTGPTGAASTVTGPTGPGSRSGVNVQDVTGTLVLTASAEKYQFLNAVDGTAILEVPTGVAVGFDLVIKETGKNFNLPIQTNTATGIKTLDALSSEAALVVWDGTVWQVIDINQ